jgi:hypothetical protein
LQFSCLHPIKCLPLTPGTILYFPSNFSLQLLCVSPSFLPSRTSLSFSLSSFLRSRLSGCSLLRKESAALEQLALQNAAWQELKKEGRKEWAQLRENKTKSRSLPTKPVDLNLVSPARSISRPVRTLSSGRGSLHEISRLRRGKTVKKGEKELGWEKNNYATVLKMEIARLQKKSFRNKRRFKCAAFNVLFPHDILLINSIVWFCLPGSLRAGQCVTRAAVRSWEKWSDFSTLQ